MAEDPDTAWREAKASYTPTQKTTWTERRRGLALIAATLAAVGVFVLGLWFMVATNRESFRYAVGGLALVTFWGVRRLLRPKTIFEDEPGPDA